MFNPFFSILRFSVVFIPLFLIGCGIKPSAVEAPQGKAQDRFPAQYPAPSTDGQW